MTALMKYLAVLGFAGALSLAATSSFAQSWQDAQFGSCNTNYYGKGPC